MRIFKAFPAVLSILLHGESPQLICTIKRVKYLGHWADVTAQSIAAKDPEGSPAGGEKLEVPPKYTWEAVDTSDGELLTSPPDTHQMAAHIRRESIWCNLGSFDAIPHRNY